VIPFELLEGGDRILSDWELEDRERRALTAMLVVLFQVRYPQALNTVIFKEGKSDIFYAKATGKVQLRPRCCQGPDRPTEEVTFLLRATKKGGVTTPPNAKGVAAGKLKQLRSGELGRTRYRPMPPPG
jgi:hypothetical protein